MASKLSSLWRYIVVGIIVLILFLPLAYNVGKSRSATGIVTSFYNDQNERQTIYVVITLDDGRRIHASAPDNFDFRKDHKVLVNERTTIFRGKNYQFLSYID